MISDNSRPDTGVTLGHSADIATATIEQTSRPRDLSGLLGHTRVAVLRALRTPAQY
jgi:hypothetical protein